MSYDSYFINVEGHEFTVNIDFDDATGAPWEESDGHGIVREGRAHAGYRIEGKRPGERVLHREGSSVWFYDEQQTTKKALKEGWSTTYIASPDGMTRRQLAALAVEEDFQYLRGWLKNDWYWCVVQVVAVHDVNYHASLGGVESRSRAYIRQVATDLAGDLVREIEHEASERAAWAARDVITTTK